MIDATVFSISTSVSRAVRDFVSGRRTATVAAV
jgi:hypothetical protein